MMETATKGPAKNPVAPAKRRRTVLGATLTVAVVIMVILGLLIEAKGVGRVLPGLFSAACFLLILLLYWLRTGDDGSRSS